MVDDFVHTRNHLLRFGDVAHHRQRKTAGLFDLIAGVDQLRLGASNDRDQRAIFRQRERHALADALTGPRYERHL